MNITEAVERACEEPSLIEALTFICVWENDRAVKQALRGERDADGKLWDTCFGFCIQEVMKAWREQGELDLPVKS